MPFALPAAASAISAAAPAVAAKATMMATLKTVAFNALTSLAISSALSAFQPVVGQSGRTFEFVIDPDGPIPFAAGRIGVAGSVVHRDTFGPDLMYYGIPAVLSGAGPISGIEAVKADDYPMSFDGNGGATTEPYRQELYFRSVLGAQPAPVALSTPSGLKKGATLPGWTAQHRLSGKAAFLMVMAENSKGSAFPTGEVKPLITLRGLLVYDPRKDSTYPGGSGPQRLNDPSTWTYSANPLLWALKWCLGLWEGPNGKGAPQVDYQVGGIGAKPSGIDFPAFVAAANIADANGWTVSAYPNTDDDKSQVLDAFLQAGGCIYSQRAGKISCIQRAAPRASIVTISVQDTAGPLEIDTAASRIDRINTLRPRFWSEPHRWQMTALTGEVTAQAYRDEDGAVRSRGLDYPYVSNAKQCGQLAALQIANTREGIAGVIPLKPHLQRIRPGDAFTITEPGFVLDGLKCLCLHTDYDPATGIVRVSFVSETDAKYPFALGQNPTPPTPQVLTPVDPRFVSPPEPGDWTITPRPPAPGGGQLPGFDLGGIVSNETATAIIVEYGPTATGPWKQAYQGPPTVTNIPIDGVQPGGTYYIAVQYQREQNFSERYVYGPYTAPLLVSDDTTHLNGTPVTEITDRLVGAEELLDITRERVDELTTVVESAEGEFGQALILVGQKVEAAEDAARVSTGAATVATGAAGDALTYRGQTSELRNDAVAARDESRAAAQTAGNAAASAVVQNASATAAAAQAGISANLAAQVGKKPNRLINSDFSNGLVGWSAAGGPWNTYVHAQFGPLAHSTSAGDVYLVSDPTRVDGGAVYTVSVLGDQGPTPGAAAMYFRYRRADGSIISDGNHLTHLFGISWQDRKSVTFTTPSDAAFIEVTFWRAASNTYPLHVSRVMLSWGAEMAPWNNDAAAVDLNARLSVTASVAADAQTRLGQAVIETIGSSGGGGVFQFLMRAVGATSVGRMVASGLEFCNVIGDQVVKVMELIDGSVFITGVLVIGNRNAGRIEINGPGMRIDVFDDLNRLRGRFGKLS